MLASLVLLAAVAAAADETVELKEVRAKLPRAVGGIAYRDREDFTQAPGLGYGLSYAGKSCRVTVYVYDAGEADIPDGKAGKPIDAQIKKAAADIAAAQDKGFVSNVAPMKEGPPLPKVVLATFAAAGFTYDVKGGACKGYVLVAGRNKHFVKLRVTQFIVDGKTNDAELHDFLGAVAKALGGEKN